jgi:hypothetical protein
MLPSRAVHQDCGGMSPRSNASSHRRRATDSPARDCPGPLDARRGPWTASNHCRWHSGRLYGPSGLPGQPVIRRRCRYSSQSAFQQVRRPGVWLQTTAFVLDRAPKALRGRLRSVKAGWKGWRRQPRKVVRKVDWVVLNSGIGVIHRRWTIASARELKVGPACSLSFVWSTRFASRATSFQ